jgi:hypothetical protein
MQHPVNDRPAMGKNLRGSSPQHQEHPGLPLLPLSVHGSCIHHQVTGVNHDRQASASGKNLQRLQPEHEEHELAGDPDLPLLPPRELRGLHEPPRLRVLPHQIHPRVAQNRLHLSGPTRIGQSYDTLFAVIDTQIYMQHQVIHSVYQSHPSSGFCRTRFTLASLRMASTWEGPGQAESDVIVLVTMAL